MKLYLASNNAHKIEELKTFFQQEELLAVKLACASELGGMPEVDETESSFVGNARLKAQALHARASQQKPVWILADDSGLQVDALQGAPGVYSARFAGPGGSAQDCINLLLEKLAAVEIEKRSAQFVCTLVLLGPKGQEAIFEGIAAGNITTEVRGQEGFGYDPIFVPEGYCETYAQMGPERKNAISHRTRALKQLVAFVREQLS